jgi:hypothetical protein
MTPPRWARSALACFCFFSTCCASRRLRSSTWRRSASFCDFASARRSAREGFGASGVSSSASEAPAAIPASTASISAMSPEIGT